MRSIFSKILTAVFIASFAVSTAASARADDGPVIPKRAIFVRLWRYTRHFPTPTAKEPDYKTWCWVPQLEFQVIGPVPGGSQWIVEFNKPTGAPWLVRKCETQEVAAGDVVTVKTPDVDDIEKKATTAKLGVFPFKIRLKNELAGTNTVMFSGKFSVKTYAPNQSIPEYKNKGEYFVDEDSRIPIGYIWLDPTQDDVAFPLKVSMWFHNAGTGEDIKAILYKDGAQVAAASNSTEDTELMTGVDDNPHRWVLHTFQFAGVCKLKEGAEEPEGYTRYYLNKFPGNYTIKVIRGNKLARSAQFSVDAAGNVVDNGIAKANHLGGIRMVLPIKVIGTSDGPYNVLAWKNGAFYGNPMAGFVAP